MKAKKLQTILVLLMSSISMNPILGQLQNGLVKYWSMDEQSGSRLNSVNTSISTLTSAEEIKARDGMNDGSAFSRAAYLFNNQLVTSSIGLNYNESFSVSGWFSLEEAETYYDPISQALIGQYVTTNNQREWLIFYKEDVSYPYAAPNNLTQRGAIIFRISIDGTSSNYIEVVSDFLVYTDGLFFVSASYDLSADKISLVVGNDVNNLITNTTPLNGQRILHNGSDLGVGRIGSSIFPMYGRVDNIGIWNRVLSSEELADLAKGHTPYSTPSIPNLKISCIGNSITYGFACADSAFYGGDKAEFSYPRRLDSLLPINYEVSNYGSRGTRTEHGIQNVNSHIIDMDYDIVTVAYGINDLRFKTPCKTAGEIIAELEELYSIILTDPDVVLVKLTITPYKNDIYMDGPPCSNFESIQNEVNAFIREYESCKSRVLCVDAYNLMDTDHDFELDSIYNDLDHIHPNQQGLDRIATAIANVLNEFISPCEQVLSPHIVTNPVGVQMVGTDIARSAGGSGWGTSGGSSNQKLHTGDYFHYNVMANRAVMVGLSDKDIDAHHNTIDYALYTRHDVNQIYVYESGVCVFTSGLTYNENTELKVTFENHQVIYSVNGVDLTYKSTVPCTITELVFDFSIFSANARINDLHFMIGQYDSDADGVFDNEDFCQGTDDDNTGVYSVPLGCIPDCDLQSTSYTVTDQIGINVNGNDIVKTDVTGWGNGGGSSNVQFYNFDFLEFKALTGKCVMVGLSHQNSNAHYTTIDYAIYARSDNKIYVYENGVQKTLPLATYTNSSTIKVQVVNGTVRYFFNGTLLPYCSLIEGDGPLVLDFAMYENGSQINDLAITACGVNVPRSLALIRGEGVKFNEGEFVSIFPNPISGNCTMVFNTQSDFEEVLIEIYDSNGKLVQSLKTASTETSKSMTVDMSFLRQGLYLIKCSTNSLTQVTRAVVGG